MCVFMSGVLIGALLLLGILSVVLVVRFWPALNVWAFRHAAESTDRVLRPPPPERAQGPVIR
jgi:hypothetical protein